MKRQLALLMLLSQMVGGALAESDVYLCIGDNGNKEYKNTGATKGCKKVDLPGITMVPVPNSVKRATQAAASKTSAPAASTPTDFPKVESSAQKARDSDRRQILMDEMKAEEQKLANLKKEYNNGEPERHGDERNYAKYQERVATMRDEMLRTDKNIEALRREIGNLK